MPADYSEKLALEGGPKAKQTPVPTRKRHGELEKKYLNEVIDSDMLFFFLGEKVREFERRFAGMYNSKSCIACSSGTAAVHIAIASLELPPGSEVITSAITDMGSVTGVLYQGLIPVFADVDPNTLNMDPASVRQRITRRTKAILVVHHAGLAADMDALLSISRETGIPLVEDCAQAFCCEYKGRLAGTMSPISAFSLNHFKHISCGSGGMVLTQDDRLRYVASLFLDKCYQREEGIRNPFFLAPNYQMTELQGAVALAQLARVQEIVNARNRLGMLFRELTAGMPGIYHQSIAKDCKHTFFLNLLRLDTEALGCTSDEFSRALAAEGVGNQAHTITGGRPVYLYDLFQKRSAFPSSSYPFYSSDTHTDKKYKQGDCPVAEQAFSDWLVVPLFEQYSEQNVREMAFGIGKVAYHFGRRMKTISLATADASTG